MSFARSLSIRARITIGSALVAILLLAGASVVVYGQVARIVDDGEEAVLDGISEAYATTIVQDPHDSFEHPRADQHVAIVDPKGNIRLDTLPTGLVTSIAEFAASGETLHHMDATEGQYIVTVTPVKTASGTWHIIAARSSASHDRVLSGVASVLLISLALIAAAFTAASWFIATAALRPVDRLRRSAQKLAVDNRGDLLPVGRAHDEIDDLAGTLNDLLARMRQAADRERQVVSDASHELRTPLAILQGQLQIAADPAAAPETARRDLRAAQATLRRLSSIAQSLLDLSRVEAQTSPGRSSAGQLAEELASQVDRTRLRTADRPERSQIDLDFEVEVEDAAASVSVAAPDFGRIVDNLVDNAIGAAGDDIASIEVSLRQKDGTLTLTVADDCGGMDPDFVPRAFERFARGRGSTYPGGGLGLPIVARTVALAGGTVDLRNRPGEGLTVVVTLPTARAGRGT